MNLDSVTISITVSLILVFSLSCHHSFIGLDCFCQDFDGLTNLCFRMRWRPLWQSQASLFLLGKENLKMISGGASIGA